MFATINVPGSSHFEYYGPANKAECEAWLKRRVAKLQETELITSLLPQQIISNREAMRWRYQDGSRVFTPEGNAMYEPAGKPSLPCGCPSTGHVRSCPGFGL